MSLHHRRADDGFTLIELVLAIAILGLVMPVLGNALWSVVGTANLQSGQQIESHDAQVVSAYFSRDVASAGLREWDVTAPPADYGDYLPTASVEKDVAWNAGANPCGSAGDPAAVVRLAWNDFPTADDPAEKVVVAYVAKPVGARWHLHRVVCRNGPAPGSDRVLARYLVSAPSATCSSTCTASSPPEEVSLTVSFKAPDQQGPASVPLDVTLTGQRRQS